MARVYAYLYAYNIFIVNCIKEVNAPLGRILNSYTTCMYFSVLSQLWTHLAYVVVIMCAAMNVQFIVFKMYVNCVIYVQSFT